MEKLFRCGKCASIYSSQESAEKCEDRCSQHTNYDEIQESSIKKIRKIKDDGYYSGIWFKTGVIIDDVAYLTSTGKRTCDKDVIYDVVPRFNRCRHLSKEVFNSYYMYYKDDRNVLSIELMLLDYVEYVIYEELYKNSNKEYVNEFHRLRALFRQRYNLDLDNYITDFIGCSRGTESVLKLIRQV